MKRMPARVAQAGAFCLSKLRHADATAVDGGAEKRKLELHAPVLRRASALDLDEPRQDNRGLRTGLPGRCTGSLGTNRRGGANELR